MRFVYDGRRFARFWTRTLVLHGQVLSTSITVFYFIARAHFKYTRMTTGVTVNDAVVEAFNAFKLHRAPHDNRFFIYKIENNSEIVMDTFGDKSKNYDDFVACLPPDDCRYGVFDLDFTTNDGRQGNKIVFISWSPDTAKIKKKMVYAGSKEAIKSALVGIGVHLQATDQGELELDYIKSQVQKV